MWFFLNLYLQAILALAFAGSAALGWLLTTCLPPARRLALTLPVALRGFAGAAGIATTAFGPPPQHHWTSTPCLSCWLGLVAAQITHRPRADRQHAPTDRPRAGAAVGMSWEQRPTVGTFGTLVTATSVAWDERGDGQDRHGHDGLPA